MASRSNARIVAAAGCFAAAPLFVLPSGRPVQGVAPVVHVQQAQQAQPSSSSASMPAVGTVMAGAAVAVAASLSRRPQVARNFFGGAPAKKAFDPSAQAGVQDPVGFWDPAGYTNGITEEEFNRYRSIELKHGRIAMLATMGYITPEITGKLPGDLDPQSGLKFADIPNGLQAIGKVPALGWAQILAYMAFTEVSSPGGAGGDVVAGTPGDVGWLTGYYSDTRRNAELANGRLAMMAFVGMVFQDGLTGSAWGDWALYTASPLRFFGGGAPAKKAFDPAAQAGVQDPVGFWDPAGYTNGITEEEFNRYRSIELKHGRIAMLATMGYITPEITGKLPGDLDPQSGLKFADIPNGLQAIGKVPALGWAQILAYMAFTEVSSPGGAGGDVTAGTPGDVGWLTGYYSDTRRNAELANGRLAMMAFVGMVFQDGLTGSAWGDWALYTASPLRFFGGGAPAKKAFDPAAQAGVQDPVGFWDPAGYTNGITEEEFNRYRSIELKHGRIAMLATMGYITPEITGKLPGDLDPQSGLKFADIPNGLQAIGKVPALGWAQILAYMAFTEVSSPGGAGGDVAAGTPGDVGWLTGYYSDTRRNAELANGRLAMMAFVGMVFQDGLTGSAWGDWALYTASPLRFFGGGAPAKKAFDPAAQAGVQDPVGFWDPAGYTNGITEEEFNRYRSIELKHGRIAMLATMGYITPEITGKLPGDLDPQSGLKFADIPNGLQAIGKVPALGWAQILAYMAFTEVSSPGGAGGDVAAGTPGDVGWLTGYYSDTRRNAELANGRLAMMAFVGMVFQDGLTGSAWGDWALYTASPLRGFETELGVQAPVGFWDPLGYTADGSVKNFQRNRSIELKHGRIAMLATMGYITPEIAGKFPGYLDPTTGLKFADIPNGLAAISKVPAGGWTQILLYMAFTEVKPGVGSDLDRNDPGNFNWLTEYYTDTRRNAELANGRLAMMAITGMVVQDGLTGSAWGDWALYTDSPLRFFGGSAPAKKVFDPAAQAGVQDPVGFWDPAGYTNGITEEEFNRYRSIELKHGRIAMLATMGYITPEITGKLPGDLDPQSGLKFADIPNGLQAIGKVPALGWAQILAYMAFTEVSSPGGAGGDVAAGTPGDVGWLTGYYSDTRRNAELANGRLAMMAFVGMVFQDGLTGSAWGDWALYTASPLRAFDPSAQAGVQAPVGFFDPAGLCADNDEATFLRYRSIELKHGRIAMLATMGYITPEIAGKFPGYLDPSAGLKFADIPNGLAAISKVPGLGWAQIIAYMSFCETNPGLGSDIEKKAPGDFGFLTGFYSDTRRNAELANGRLAMAAITGMVFQDGLTGSAWGDWALYTASPLRFFGGSGPKKPAFEASAQLGVQAPIGFWDPAGFSKDNDEATFNRYRSIELKHGRIAMLATMGYITPEITGKLPGYLAPDLPFADIPNGLAAIDKVPYSGWLQILAWMIYAEVAPGAGSDLEAGTPGDFGWKVITSTVPEIKARKLAAELANGRLAMVAIIGMIVQDGLTGSAWGDWALYTDSPLRAQAEAPPPPPPFNPASQVGVTGPLGFFDPAGFSKVGDEAGFRNLRIAEIKHARVAMMAALGAVAQHFMAASTAPGVPAGLGAVTAAPAGFAALFLASGALEFTLFKQEDNKEPGNFNDPAGLGDYSVDSRNRELNNGRFAMFAAIGIVAADLLTGKDAVQQFGL